MFWRLHVICIAGLLAVGVGYAATQTPSSDAASDPNSDRLTFLTLQLSSVEESIKALTAGMKAAGYKANVAADKVENYQKGNELMDRKGGAPVPWDEFYGKTAKGFYYHSSSDVHVSAGHGSTVVDAHSNGSRLTRIDRPKQFDYIYKANNDQAAKAKAEVAEMGKKVDLMLARRRKLEGDQSALWATISLEEIQNLEVSYRPLYRLQLKAATTQPAATPAVADARVAVIRALATFVRTADRAASSAGESINTDQEKALTSLRDTVQAAQTNVQEKVFRATEGGELSAADSEQIHDVVAIIKRLQSICKNMTEAYRLALEGDAAQDEPRKLTFRAQLQESLLAFADTTSEVDSAVSKLAASWAVRGQPGTESPDVLPPSPPAPTPGPASIAPPPAATPAPTATDVRPITPTLIPPAGQKVRKVFAPGETLSADYMFSAAEGPYQIQDRLAPAKGIKQRLHVFAGPGSEIRDGSIEIGGDLHIDIKGDPANPPVFRNVTFDQGWNGYFIARHVIFDHCTFRKTGSTYNRAGYTAKWKLDGCLLNECTFTNLSWIDNGVEFSDSTLVGMSFPELGIHTTKDKPKDHMNWLRTSWRKFDHCTFDNCTIPPTLFWCSESSNFYRCKFKPGDAFESDKPTTVQAYVAQTVGDAPDKVFALNPPKRSPLNVVYASQPMPVFAFQGWEKSN